MKINKIKIVFAVSLMLIFIACEPIVDEEALVNNTTVDNVELVALQSTTGGNQITLKMNTPGITGHWDYFFGKGLTDRITFNFPLTGTYNFKYKGTLGAEFFVKTVSVTIDVLDHPVAPEWGALLGDDPFAGKNWIYNTDEWAWWYMAAPGDPNGWAGVWWDANSCCAPGDAGGKMHFYFDPEDGIKYDYYADPNGTPVNANYVLKPADGDFGSIKIIEGENILGGYNERGKSSGEYTIISLVDDEFILYADVTDAGDSGWTYVFKPE